MKYNLIAYILLCSLGFWVRMELRIAQEMYFQIGAFALILSMLFLKVKPVVRNKVSVLLGALGIYTLFLFLLGYPMGFNVMLNIITGLIVYFLTLQLEREDTILIVKTVIWICVLNITYIALQHGGYDFIYQIRGPGGTILYNTVDSVGLLGLKAVVGMWMGLGTIAMMMINPLLSVLFLIPIYMSKSSGVIFGLTAAIMFYLYYANIKWFKVIIPIALILGTVYVVKVDNPMGMMNTRPPMWKMAIKDTIYGFKVNEQEQSPLLRNPFTGFGLDSFRAGPIKYFMTSRTHKTIRLVSLGGSQLKTIDGMPIHTEGHRIIYNNDESLDYWDNPHNEFVQLFFEMGLIGVLLFGFIVFEMVKRFRRSIKTKALLVVTSLIIMLFGSGISQFPFHLARIGVMLPILLGLFVVLTDD